MNDILKLAEELGVAGVKFQTVQYLDAVEKPYKFKKPPEDIEYIKSLRGRFSINFDYFHKSMRYSLIANILNRIKSIKKYIYCPNNRNFLKVDIDGRVLSCSMQNASVFGDLNKNSLEEILGSCDIIRKECVCDPMARYLKR
jgi:MoaA/NifB/PqqE/SkfB family radical SAM enzyme